MAHRANGMIELQHKCTESGEVHEVSTLEQTLSMMHACMGGGTTRAVDRYIYQGTV